MRDAHSSTLNTPADPRPPRPEAPQISGFQPLQWLRTRLKAKGAAANDTASPAGESPGQALRQAHRVLRNLMKERPALRVALPHLGLVEQALGRKGSRALKQLPLLVMRRALDQLEGLQASEPRDALRPLRARLIEAIDHRTPNPHQFAGPGLLVYEATHSDFDAAEASWTGRMPLDFEGDAWAETSVESDADTEHGGYYAPPNH